MIHLHILIFYCAFNRFDRVATSDVTIGEMHIKKGMAISFPMYAIHRDPDIWEDPERYDPER